MRFGATSWRADADRAIVVRYGFGRPEASERRQKNALQDMGLSKASPDTVRLLIRRSLVRAQVGEPRISRGYVERRSPFVFLYRQQVRRIDRNCRSPVDWAGEKVAGHAGIDRRLLG
jgi:hypothetical protein